MKKNYGRLAVFLAVIILTLAIAPSGFASDTAANLKAYYRNIKIFRNGTQVQMAIEPFIVDGTTYLPLRSISELLEKDITWDGVNYTIGINDKPGTNVNQLYSQVLTQQQTISQLEAKIKSLEAQLDGKTSSITTISAMEKYLNKEYGTFKKIEFDIDLSETKSKIEVEIFVDLDDYDTKWDNLTTTEKKGYIQDIVDDIRESFSNKTISGYIEDSSYDEKILSFSVNTKGTVSTSTTTSSTTDVEDMEYDLDKTYSGKNGIKSVELDESKSKLYLVLNVDKIAWNKLSYDKQDDILEDMYDDIRYYFDETIYGEIRNNSTGALLFEFDYNSKGTVTVD